MGRYNVLKQIRSAYYFERIYKRRKRIPINDETLNIVQDVKKIIKDIDNRVSLSGLRVYKIDEKPSVTLKADIAGYYDSVTNAVYVIDNIYEGKYIYYCICVHEILHFIHHQKGNLYGMFTADFEEGINNLLTHWLIWKSGRFPNRTENGEEIESKYWCYIKEMKIAKNVIKRANLSMKDVFYNYCMHNLEFFEKFVPQKYFKHYY